MSAPKPVATDHKTNPVRHEAACLICQHPLRDRIDDLLKMQEDDRAVGRETMTYVDIIAEIEKLSPPDAPKLNPWNITRHKQRHSADKKILGYVLSDGQVIDSNGQRINHVTIKDGLKTVITLGMKAILDGKATISPRDTLTAIKLLADISRDEINLDEMNQAWLELQKKQRARRKARPTDTVTPDPGERTTLVPASLLADDEDFE